MTADKQSAYKERCRNCFQQWLEDHADELDQISLDVWNEINPGKVLSDKDFEEMVELSGQISIQVCSK